MLILIIQENIGRKKRKENNAPYFQLVSPKHACGKLTLRSGMNHLNKAKTISWKCPDNPWFVYKISDSCFE